jgi:hypothetical protein
MLSGGCGSVPPFNATSTCQSALISSMFRTRYGRNFELVQSSIFSGYQNKMDCFLILGGSKASYHGSSCDFWFHGKVLWCSIGEHRRKPSFVASARAIKTITSHRQCGAILSGGVLMRTSIAVHFRLSFSTYTNHLCSPMCIGSS